MSARTFSGWGERPGNAEFHPFQYAHLLFFGKIDPWQYQHRGLPKERIQLYNGTIKKPGLLLTARYVLIPRPALVKLGIEVPARYSQVAMLNRERLPAGAQLVASFKLTNEYPLDVYRVE